MGELDSFGKWLRHRRRELDLTQDELARQVGCAPITIRKLEGELMHPSKQLAESLSVQLGIAPNDRNDFVRFARNNKQTDKSSEHPQSTIDFPKSSLTPKPELPSGTLSMLFCSLGANLQVFQSLGDKYGRTLEEFQPILLNVFSKWNGRVIDDKPDSYFTIFTSAIDAVDAAVELLRTLDDRQKEDGSRLNFQIGIHTGEPMLSDKDYVGEDVHRAARICAAAHPGQILLSDETRVLVERHLNEDVSLRGLGRFWLKDLEKPEDIYQLVIAGLTSDFQPLNSLDVMPNNLPVQFTSFIGREREIAEVLHILDSSRLTTLTGTGGTGKTRLAIEVAGRVLNKYPDGAWLINFADLHESTLVQQTIASSLRIREERNRPLLQTLIDYLRSKNILLIFDNCEHLVAACVEVVDTLLQNCPYLRIFVTSREAFGIAGEYQYHVPSLSLPELKRELTMDILTRSEAVSVFLDRAEMVNPTFILSLKNGAVITKICQRLDGIPLAIELAAARTGTLSVEQIVEHLDNRFRLLNTGNRAALPRQQTLRATMDWSYNLLSENERILFTRLSVFAAGWTLEAAQTVCSDDRIKKQELLELLLNLVDKSLVIVEDREGVTRYRFLETIREYAREKLVETGDEEIMRDNHLNYYNSLAETAQQKFMGKDQLLWLGIMEMERDNLRTARDHTLQKSRSNSSLRFVGTAFWLWFFRGPWSEGQHWAETALANSSKDRTGEKSKALLAYGLFNFLQSDYSAARLLLEESLEIWRQIEDPWWTAFTLTFLGRSMRGQEQEQVSKVFKESLDLARESNESWILAFSLWNAGEHQLRLKNLPEADRLLEESLKLSRSLEDRMLQNEVLHALGGISESKQEFTKAVTLYKESLALVRELANTTTISAMHYDLGRALQLTGNNDEAAMHFTEALNWSRRLGKKSGISRALGGMGVVAMARGKVLRGVRLLTLSKLYFVKLGVNYSSDPDLDQTVWIDKSLESARLQLGEEQYKASRIEGETMTLDEAVDLALNSDEDDRL